jgi:hypothetical protein
MHRIMPAMFHKAGFQFLHYFTPPFNVKADYVCVRLVHTVFNYKYFGD